MRVLLVVRPSVYERGGGDMTQALFTKRGLEALGVEVDLVATTSPQPSGYDIAHIFGVFDPEICEPQIAACKAAGVPIALSPIWWDLYAFFGRSRWCERILSGSERRIGPKLRELQETDPKKLLRTNETRKYKERIARQTALMRCAGVLLPNSAIEAHFYATKLRLHDHPTVVVYNAFDPPATFERSSSPRSGVVCVARIEQKKNQAMLLYALRDLDVEITLIGAHHEQSYLDLCKRWASPRVRMLGGLARDDVYRELNRAAVHVLPSWAETPGIANLEAAAAGARIIASNDGTECEYFGELATYVDPLDPAGMRAAIERALSLPQRTADDALDRRIASFSPAAVGARTREGYRHALR